jgi:hypothetical protein
MESDYAQQPTVFHVTHWKAGSQWLHKILREVAADRIIAPQIYESQFLDSPLTAGAIYPTVYVSREQFNSVALPENHRKFVIVRDLRDTLVSAYFSIRYSHPLIAETLADWRRRLDSSSIEDGLLILMDEWLPASAQIQESWVRSGEKFIRYEDLLKNDTDILEEVLIHQCEIQIDPNRLHEIVVANRFENLTGGRKPGDENLMAHERKGIAGDWENYFTPLVLEKFNERHGRLVVDAGYELTRVGAA